MIEYKNINKTKSNKLLLNSKKTNCLYVGTDILCTHGMHLLKFTMLSKQQSIIINKYKGSMFVSNFPIWLCGDNTIDFSTIKTSCRNKTSSLRCIRNTKMRLKDYA